MSYTHRIIWTELVGPGQGVRVEKSFRIVNPEAAYNQDRLDELRLRPFARDVRVEPITAETANTYTDWSGSN